MRYLLVALMIALLPLRSLAGDAMALGMAVQQASTMKVKSAEPQFAATEAAMPEDCAMHEAASSGSKSSPLCGGCDTCDLCLAVASLGNGELQLNSLMPALERISSNSAYTSADSAAGLKPPIY